MLLKNLRSPLPFLFWLSPLALSCTSPSPSLTSQKALDRQPAWEASSGVLQFVYYGEDENQEASTLNLDSVKGGIDRLVSILKTECGMEVKYTLEKRPGLRFEKNIEFSLTKKTVATPDGPLSFIYDQADLYREFRAQKITKKRNEIDIIKTAQLGAVTLGGSDHKDCGYANPEIQFDPGIPAGVKAQLRNTIVFNADQSGCPKNFSFVLAHEISHLLVQDEVPHTVTDDLKNFFQPPLDNLINTAGGARLSRKYQCPRIKETLRGLFADEKVALPASPSSPATKAPPLIRLTKESIDLNPITGSQKLTERTGRCLIQTDGSVQYQLFQGAYRPDKDTLGKLTPQDLDLLVKVLTTLKQSREDSYFLREYDFTGDITDEMGIKKVKSDDGVAYVDSMEVPFYWMRRRLVNTYKGPGAPALRELLRKYCFMDI